MQYQEEEEKEFDRGQVYFSREKLILYPQDIEADNLLKLQESYNYKYNKSISNLVKCECSYSTYKCVNEKCNAIYKILKTCGIRFCKKEVCITHRIHKTEKKLDLIFGNAKLGYHFVNGSNQLSFNESNKAFTKYINLMRKKINPITKRFYEMNYIKSFDIGKKNFKETGLYWLHNHGLLLFEKINTKHFIKDSQEVISKIPGVVFNNIGWRKKESLSHYFAKRNAGEYGHGKDLFYLQDIMDLKTFLTKYSNRKFLTFSKSLHLACRSRNRIEPITCALCNSELEYTGEESKKQFKVEFNVS